MRLLGRFLFMAMFDVKNVNAMPAQMVGFDLQIVGCSQYLPWPKTQAGRMVR